MYCHWFDTATQTYCDDVTNTDLEFCDFHVQCLHLIDEMD